MPAGRGARMLRPSSEEGAQMKANVGGFDKWARIVVGVLLIG